MRIDCSDRVEVQAYAHLLYGKQIPLGKSVSVSVLVQNLI